MVTRVPSDTKMGRQLIHSAKDSLYYVNSKEVQAFNAEVDRKKREKKARKQEEKYNLLRKAYLEAST